MAQNAIPSLSWRPVPLRLVHGASRLPYGLGQASTSVLKVSVVDIGGKHVGGADVDLSDAGRDISDASVTLTQTDSHGEAVFQVPPGNYEIRASYKGLVVTKKVTPEDIIKGLTVFLQFPICIVDSLIRPVDMLIFATAAGMIAAGSYWKVKPLEMTGEIALGAAIFGLIYRLQCI